MGSVGQVVGGGARSGAGASDQLGDTGGAVIAGVDQVGVSAGAGLDGAHCGEAWASVNAGADTNALLRAKRLIFPVCFGLPVFILTDLSTYWECVSIPSLNYGHSTL
ncbi:MAG: hypothetical protein AAGG02_02620 [Cyanobacteria bacterium P01_H01_bin.15]